MYAYDRYSVRTSGSKLYNYRSTSQGPAHPSVTSHHSHRTTDELDFEDMGRAPRCPLAGSNKKWDGERFNC